MVSSLGTCRGKDPPGIDKNDEDTEKAGHEIVLGIREFGMTDGGGCGDGDSDGGRLEEIDFDGDNCVLQKTPARSQQGKAGRQKKSTRQMRSGKEQGTVVDTDKDMTDVTDMMAAVKLAPRQIRFGRGGAVGFSTRR